MKLIRMTDTRWVIDPGPGIDRLRANELQARFQEWLTTNTEIPASVVIAGTEERITYEDRREPDIEKRLKRIERRIRALETHQHITLLDRSGPPVQEPK